MKRTALVAIAGALAMGTAAAAAPLLTTLPTGWRIGGPPGPLATVGTLPTGLVLSHDGTKLFELETGHRKPVLRILDATTLRELGSVNLNGADGAPLRDEDGDGVWVAIAGTFQEQIAHIDTASGRVDKDVSLPLPFYPAAIARGADGTLAVAADLGNKVAFVDPTTERVVAQVHVGSHPAALVFSRDGKTLFVADRGESHVDVVDVAARKVRATIPVGLHPGALVSDGTRLYVADSDDDDVAVIEAASERVVQRAKLPFASDRAGIVGASPNALALEGDRLYVTCGAANAVAVFGITSAGLRALGAFGTGWYPAAIAVDRAHGALFVADGKGESGHPNPAFRPFGAPRKQYIADQLAGSIRRYPIPGDAALASESARVDADDRMENAPPPPSTIVRANGPIRHVIYVIKENRSYDEVLGDIHGADGDPSLVLFGDPVTPNQHALAQRFGVFDRFFEDSHVSADGHNWSTAAFANDYLEKYWPQNYANRRAYYDFEDAAEASRPHGGYLWDDAVAHHVSLRNYGEFVTAGPSKPTPVSVSSDTLRPNTDRNYATFDLAVEDVDRFTEWKREFDGYERTRTLPQLEIVRFPRDHTAGTKDGEVTPQGMVADNDLAVGKLVDAVSHSGDWGSTAIFVIEDDAQNGPDHVDEQRAPFYLVSPYAAGGVQHAMYTQASVLRTIEVLLGLSPMSPYDTNATVLDAAFRSTPDLRPFTTLPARTDTKARNGRTAYGSAVSATMGFSDADQVDDATLNAVLWHAIKGARATPPPYGQFR
jgi:YVTN family beta-propeller protein